MTNDVLDPAQEAPDYNVKITIRNGRLLSRLREAGYADNIAAFSRAHGLPQGTVQSIVNLRMSGMMKIKPEWRTIVIQIADILKCMPEDIVPPQHWHDALQKNTFVVEMTGDQAASLVGAHATPEQLLLRDDVQDVLGRRMRRLSPRMERVLRLHYGLTPEGREHTNNEIGDMMGLTGGRVSQMIQKAERLMKPRNKKLREEMKSYIEDLAVQE